MEKILALGGPRADTFVIVLVAWATIAAKPEARSCAARRELGGLFLQRAAR